MVDKNTYVEFVIRVFLIINNSIVYKSRHTYDEWIQFINCELHDYTLKDEATTINISQTTVFRGVISSMKQSQESKNQSHYLTLSK
jgi:hypothetical protein